MLSYFCLAFLSAYFSAALCAEMIIYRQIACQGISNVAHRRNVMETCRLIQTAKLQSLNKFRVCLRDRNHHQRFIPGNVHAYYPR